ncbi:hypothetical protein ACLB2K_056154 [Fragaria x ananassa]
MSIRNKFLSLLYILPQRKRVKQGHANGSNVVARDVYLGTGIATGSNVDPYLPIWKALWKAKVPNKVAILEWEQCKIFSQPGQL